jgi:cation transport regulator ChaC
MTIYVFGYGSLINMQENKELTQPKKSWPVIINGLKRSLNVNGKNHLVYGVKDVKTSHCNGILFKVNAEELARLQEREKLYSMKTIEKKRVEFPYKKTLHFKPADQIVSFYPQAKYVLTKKELTTQQPLQSPHYLHLCQRGAEEMGTTFYKDFLEMTTTPV